MDNHQCIISPITLRAIKVGGRAYKDFMKEKKKADANGTTVKRRKIKASPAQELALERGRDKLAQQKNANPRRRINKPKTVPKPIPKPISIPVSVPAPVLNPGHLDINSPDLIKNIRDVRYQIENKKKTSINPKDYKNLPFNILASRATELSSKGSRSTSLLSPAEMKELDAITEYIEKHNSKNNSVAKTKPAPKAKAKAAPKRKPAKGKRK